MYCNEYKKTGDKNPTNFADVYRFFALVHLNRGTDRKRYKAQRYYLPKSIIKSYNVIINGKDFYDQPINSDIKQYKEIGKLITCQGEDYTTRCLLDYEFIKNYYRIKAGNLSRQKKFDADSEAI